MTMPRVGELLFSMSGEIKAVSKQRPRTGKAGHFFTPKRTRDYERAVREMAEVFITGPVIQCPITVDISIIHKIPKSWPEWQKWAAENCYIFPSVGDLENKQKAICDALNGVAYLDDAQICINSGRMIYGSSELVTVKIYRAGYTKTEARRLYDELGKGGARMGG